MSGFGGRHARAGITDFEAAASRLSGESDGDLGVGRGVNEGVGHEIADDTMKGRFISGSQDAGFEFRGDVTGRVGRVGPLEDVLGEGGEIDGPAMERHALVEAGEEEEFFDEYLHSGAFLADAAHGVLEVLPVAQVALTPKLRQPRDGGGGGSQFVGGVSKKLAEAVFDDLLLVEHGVEGAGQGGGFDTGGGDGDSLFAVAGEDGFRGVSHAGDGAKSEAFDPESRGQEDEGGYDAGAEHSGAQFGGGGVDRAHKHRNE